MADMYIDMSEKREGLPEFDENLLCPDCNALTTEGFGLAGGGYGVYTVCIECGNVVSKTVETDDG